MSTSKRQSLVLVGIGLIIIGVVILGFALSQPKIAVSDLVQSSAQAVQNTQQSNNSQYASEVYTEEQTISQAVTENTEAAQSSDDLANVSYPLNLNTCTAEELMTISGIGEVKASAIIEYRDYLGGYTSVEQIKNIKGIGDKIYEKISPYLTV